MPSPSRDPAGGGARRGQWPLPAAFGERREDVPVPQVLLTVLEQGCGIKLWVILILSVTMTSFFFSPSTEKSRLFFFPCCQGPLQVLHYHLALGKLQRTPGVADISQDHLFHQNPIPRFVKTEAFCFSTSYLKWLNKLQPERDYQTYFPG